MLSTTPLIPAGSSWKYLDNGSDQGTGWRSPGFDDSAWRSGAAQLGYGDGDEKTVVGYGPNASSKYITTYFRDRFAVADVAAVASLNLGLLRDDGAVVYLNGVEVYRSNMPTGTITYSTVAASASSGADSSAWYTESLSAAALLALRTGDNVLAVEVHQNSRTSTDVSFDLELTASPTTAPPGGGGLVATPQARVETTPVPHSGESADDPDIWIHPSDPALSLVLGTDKLGGLHTYNLDGTERQRVSDGSMPDNVDVLYGFSLGGRTVDLAVAGVRQVGASGVKVWAIDLATRSLTDITSGGVFPAFGGGVTYGSAVYRSAGTGKFYYFVNNKAGQVEQYQLDDAGNGNVRATKVRAFAVGSETEGMVADVELGNLYIAEEDVGIWKYGAEPDAGTQRTAVARVGENGLTADVEGLTIYYATRGKGYLIASNQAISTFKVYTRDGANSFVMTIDPAAGTIDDINDTDGIAVTSVGTSGQFPSGLFVAQDASNTGNPNFKFYGWEDIAGTSLLVDTHWSPRTISAPEVPATPSDLSATAESPFRVALNWADHSDIESGFLIERSTDGVDFATLGTVGTDVTSYTDSRVTPGVTYTYQVRATNAARTSAPTNTAGATPPDPSTLTSVRFAVIGDYGSAGQPEADVAALVRSWAPDYILTLGDNNYTSGAASTIDTNIGQYYSDYIGNYQGSYGAGSVVNRFFPSLGNHDWGDSSTNPRGADPYLAYFTLPGNERYYESALGPVRFFAIDSDPNEPDGRSSTSVQANWLQARLAAATERYKIVYLHHAPYSSSVHGSTPVVQWPFKDWGATAVLSGHDHVYERLMVGGLPYFVNGLGGASLYNFNTPIAGSQVRYSGDFGAMIIDADAASMRFRFITRTGLVADDYEIPYAPPVPNATTSLDLEAPTSVSVGTPFSITVTARDAARITTPGYLGTVHFTSTDPLASLPSDYTFTSADEGVHTFTVTLSTTGSQSITATDLLSSSITGSESGILVSGVTTTTSTTLASSANPSGVGQAVTFTATVSAVAPGGGTPTGSVTFKDGAATLATVALSSTGVATLTTSALGAGSHTVTADYGGDANYRASASAGLTQAVNQAGTQTTLVSAGSSWKYLDNGSDQGTAWRAPGFDDSAWRSGAAQLGYGDGDEATVINSGPANSKYITTYFRTRFSLADASAVTALDLRLLRDDGAVVYINGVEVYRSNMPTGTINHLTRAASSSSGADSATWHTAALSTAALRDGDNVVAVEVHQVNGTSSDVSFALVLNATSNAT